MGRDTLGARRTLRVGGRDYDYYALEAAEGAAGDLSRLPVSLRILAENLLRHEDGRTVTVEDIGSFGAWLKDRKAGAEIAFRPARVLMQDFTGVPAVVDLAAMRHAMAEFGGDPQKINPLNAVDLVIDHSVMVDSYGSADAFHANVGREFERNRERYEFLRWGQSAFRNFRVVPPGTGICHQVNLEYLARTVWTEEQDGRTVAMPDTVVGTDSHTTMVNGLGVLGWGVGGIEAEAAMLGQPISMLIPEVVGFELTGRMPEGATATDLVLRVVEMLRAKGVVGKFVEFHGPGLDALALADRATIANMAPEYGATCGFFPVDGETLNYLRFTGREEEQVALVEAYAKAQGLWREAGMAAPVFSDTLSLDLSSVEPALAGPKRPQDRVALSGVPASFEQAVAEIGGGRAQQVEGADYAIEPGHVVIAAITSCTNTSNPSVLVAAGLLARNALERGLKVKPWVKTSLAPGSQVVTDYLEAAGLQEPLDALGFNLVGYGCTTCIGNSGPLAEPIAEAVEAGDITVGAVLSGNRNFEGRVHAQVKANYLASPPLVVAYALAGSLTVDLAREPARAGRRRQSRLSPRHLAGRRTDSRDPRERALAGHVPRPLRQCVRRAGGMARNPRAGGRDLPLERRLHLCPPRALFPGHGARTRAGLRHLRGEGPAFARGQHHHRPHLARRRDQARRPGGRLSDRPPGAAGGVQLLRRPARQSRSDDARHLRQYPHPQRARPRHRRRLHHAPALRRGHVRL